MSFLPRRNAVGRGWLPALLPLLAGCSALFTDDYAANTGATAGAGGESAAAGKASSGGAGNAGNRGGAAGGSGFAGASLAGAAGSASSAGSAGGVTAGGGGNGTGGGSAGTSAGQAGGGASAAGQGGAGASAAGQGGATAGGQGGASAGAAGQGGASAGAAGQAGTTAGAAGQAGTTAGAGGQTGGASGSGGQAAGAGGSASACPTMTPGTPPTAAVCGNGVVETGEECDDAGTGGEGCTGCQFQCPASFGIRVGDKCYGLSSDRWFGNQAFYVPFQGGASSTTVVAARLDDADLCGNQSGPTTHMAVLQEPGERAALADSLLWKAYYTNALSGKVYKNAWIGAGVYVASGANPADPTQWGWSEGRRTTAADWAPGFPAQSGPLLTPNGCGELSPDGLLENESCQNAARRPVVCEREPACALVSPGSPPVIGYRAANGHCYARLTNKTNWAQARAACEGYGAHLATFETIDELRGLPGANLSFDDSWIGARRDACTQVSGGAWFAWITNGATVPPGSGTDGHWATGEPNDTGNDEDCAELNLGRRINDLACSKSLRALCERDF